MADVAMQPMQARTLVRLTRPGSSLSSAHARGGRPGRNGGGRETYQRGVAVAGGGWRVGGGLGRTRGALGSFPRVHSSSSRCLLLAASHGRERRRRLGTYQQRAGDGEGWAEWRRVGAVQGALGDDSLGHGSSSRRPLPCSTRRAD
jgi:hypothetical protein